MVGPVELYTDSSNIKLELEVGPVKTFTNSCNIKREQVVWSIKVYTDGGNIKLEQVLWVTRLLQTPAWQDRLLDTACHIVQSYRTPLCQDKNQSDNFV